MNKKRFFFITSLLLILYLCAILSSFAFGARQVSLLDIRDAFMKKENLSFAAKVVSERIPRTIFGLIAGASLSISGSLMQAITKNPIADPAILGVNTGASLFVVVGMTFFGISTANQYIWLALLGASITSVFVYFIASFGKDGANPLSLALSGAAVSTALSSLVSIIILPNSRVMDSFRFWQVGSIGGASFASIKLLLPFFIFASILAFILSPYLNTLALGDEMATSLGVNPNLVRLYGALSGVILAGATTALAGPIGFVGLMIPHLMRLFFGDDQRLIVFFSSISGGILLLFSDVIGRLIGGSGELEVGIVTAFIGAPFFMFLIRRAKVGHYD